MSLIYFLVISAIVFSIYIYFTNGITIKRLLDNPYLIIIIIGLLVRIIASVLFKGIDDDLISLKHAAKALSEGKIFNGNISVIYAYFLYFIGKLTKLLGTNIDGYTFSLFIKLPLIVTDIITSCIIYNISFKRTKKQNALIFAVAYVLNPCAILLSASWGIYDSIFVLFLIMAINSLKNDFYSIFKAFIFYTIAILSKPESIIFIPIFIFSLINYYKNCLSVKKADKLFNIIKLLLTVSILGILIVYFFIYFLTLNIPIKKFINLNSPYTTVNAFNLFAFLRTNWLKIDEKFILFSFKTIDYFFKGIIFMILFYLNKIDKRESKYFDMSVFLSISFFMFTVGNHEKYFFPILLLILFSYIFNREKILLLLYFLFTGTMLLNCYAAFFAVSSGNYDKVQGILEVASLFNLILYGIFIYSLIKLSKKQDKIIIENANRKIFLINYENIKIEPSEEFQKYTKKDFIYISVIIIVYAIVAYSRLGDMKAPITGTEVNENEELIMEFDTNEGLNRGLIFIGELFSEKAEISYSDDKKNWTIPKKIDLNRSFGWVTEKISIPIENNNKIFDEFGNEVNEELFNFDDAENNLFRYVKLVPIGGKISLIEIGYQDKSKNILKPINIDFKYSSLFDEQDLIPEMFSYMNSAIFDESYYNQTAYQFINKNRLFEWTHPHLGKYFIVLGIKLFGMNPFGWRFMGTFFGVLMVFVIYLFSKRVFKNSNWALFSAILMSTDFMHFVQTRLATIDTYVTFFVMLMFYFMFKYYKTSFYDKDFKKTLLPLFFSGLFMGLGMASKWPAAYGALGLAVIFFYTLYKRYIEALKIDIFVNKYEKAVLYENQINEYLNNDDTLSYFQFQNYLATIGINSQYDDFKDEQKLKKISNRIEEEKINSSEFIKKLNFKTDNIMPIFYKKAILTCLWSVLFFILIPIIIYILSYVPHYNISKITMDSTADNGFISFISKVTQNMFKFHSTLNDTHPYSSQWFKWLINFRPILYYISHEIEGKAASISAFFNPFIVWMGLISLMYSFILLSKRKSQNLIFLLIAYFSQLAPWILIITRTTYVYHYFPCLGFLILIITFYFKDYVNVKNKKLTYLYLASVIILFILFYPVLAGVFMDKDYINIVLRWFSSWWFF